MSREPIISEICDKLTDSASGQLHLVNQTSDIRWIVRTVLAWAKEQTAVEGKMSLPTPRQVRDGEIVNQAAGYNQCRQDIEKKWEKIV